MTIRCVGPGAFPGSCKETDMHRCDTLPPAINPDMVRLARLPVAQAFSGLSKTHLYGIARIGLVRFVKCGRSTLVDMESLRAYLASLPDARMTPPKSAA